MLLHTLALPAQAYQRIVSLKPNITEILFTLGLGPQVVGVTQFCDRPEAVQALPKVADYIRVDAEKVIRLNPDLVIGSTENSSQKEVYFLMERNIPVKLYDFSNLKQIAASTLALGKELGKSSEAQTLVRTMQGKLEALRLASQSKTRKRVLFVVGSNPLVVASSNNFLDDATQYLNAVNVAGASRLRYPTYSSELVIRGAPDVIFEMTMGSEKSASTREERLAWWRRYSSLPAVQTGQIYFLDISRMRPVPGLPDFYEEIFKLLHP